jgi:hypothetical protein
MYPGYNFITGMQRPMQQFGQFQMPMQPMMGAQMSPLGQGTPQLPMGGSPLLGQNFMGPGMDRMQRNPFMMGAMLGQQHPLGAALGTGLGYALQHFGAFR